MTLTTDIAWCLGVADEALKMIARKDEPKAAARARRALAMIQGRLPVACSQLGCDETATGGFDICAGCQVDDVTDSVLDISDR